MTTTAKAPATPKVTTPKKRRTRKAAPKAQAKVTVTTFKGGTVVAKKTEFTRPSTARLITWERYQKDISTRWQIHHFEIQELIKDLNKIFDFVTPYHTEMVKRLKTINF